MLYGERPPTPSEMAKLAELYALNQLSKRGAAFVSYPPPWQVTPRHAGVNQASPKTYSLR